jgi:pimeloyl-ACP methyl ester carboxylesterase
MNSPKVETPWPVRTWRGVTSSLATPMLPLGGFWIGRELRQGSLAKFDQGLAIVLSGIEGSGPLSWNICKGLVDSGFAGAVVNWEWTTGLWPLFLYHLRSRRRNRLSANKLAEFILQYEREYPGRPIYLIGHSGGGAMTVWTLEAFPEREVVTAAVMLGPALSHDYDLTTALARVKVNLWSFWSYGDAIFCAAGTVLCGCADGRHSFSAGFRGFSLSKEERKRTIYQRKLRQVRYTPRFAKQFHFGGHFGLANRVFVAETVAPLLQNRSDRGEERCAPTV